MYINTGHLALHILTINRHPNLLTINRHPNLLTINRHPNLLTINRHPNLLTINRHPNLASSIYSNTHCTFCKSLFSRSIYFHNFVSDF